MATIEKRISKNGTVTWRSQIRKKGFPHIEKSFKTEQEAIDFATSVENSFESIGQIPLLPLGIWLDRYHAENPNIRNMGFINYWREMLGNEIAVQIPVHLIQITADNLYNIKTRNGRPYTPESRRKYLIFLSALFKMAINSWKWADDNPIRNISKDKVVRDNNVKEGNFYDWKKYFVETLSIAMGEPCTVPNLRKYISMPKTNAQNILDLNRNNTLDLIKSVLDKFDLELVIKPKSKD